MKSLKRQTNDIMNQSVSRRQVCIFPAGLKPHVVRLSICLSVRLSVWDARASYESYDAC